MTTLGILILLISCSNNGTDNRVTSYLKENYAVDWEKVESISVEEMSVYYDKDNPPQLEKLNVKFLEH